MEENEPFENAVGELKRADHLYYVSLKYTRTVDVIKHVIQRLISCFEHGFDAILMHAKQKKKVKEIPSNIGLKCDLLKETFSNDTVLQEYINFYFLLKKIMRASYTKREEFRRHVTMIASIDNGEIIEVSIDSVKSYYMKTREFIEYVKNMVSEEKHG